MVRFVVEAVDATVLVVARDEPVPALVVAVARVPRGDPLGPPDARVVGGVELLEPLGPREGVEQAAEGRLQTRLLHLERFLHLAELVALLEVVGMVLPDRARQDLVGDRGETLGLAQGVLHVADALEQVEGRQLGELASIHPEDDGVFAKPVDLLHEVSEGRRVAPHHLQNPVEGDIRDIVIHSTCFLANGHKCADTIYLIMVILSIICWTLDLL